MFGSSGTCFQKSAPLRRIRSTRSRSAPIAHIGPQKLYVFIAHLVAPRRHRRWLAIEHRVAEAIEVVLGKLAQIEGDAAGIDHVAAMAGHTEVLVDAAAELGIIAARVAAQRHDQNDKRRTEPAPSNLAIWRTRRTRHYQTFF